MEKVCPEMRRGGEMNIHNWWVFITALILSPMAYYATIVQISRARD